MTFKASKKPIGGELEIVSDGCFYGVTNSGRSSLRWIIQSMHLKGKKVLVPDFICQIVIDIFREYEVQPVFYQIKKDFEFSISNNIKNVDALYVVKYFGHESRSFISAIKGSKLPLIIDDVFGIEVPSIGSDVRWSYFNSLRKITNISDFSQVVSNVRLVDIDKPRLEHFSNLKYRAKEVKFEFLKKSIGDEEAYLSDFSEAESFLDDHLGVFAPEDRSVHLACYFFKNLDQERSVRCQNLATAKQSLTRLRFLDIAPSFPSFLPLILRNRDRVQRELREYKIFFAVHWPELDCVSNDLTGQLLSLPIDSRFSTEKIQEICKLIEMLDQ